MSSQFDQRVRRIFVQPTTYAFDAAGDNMDREALDSGIVQAQEALIRTWEWFSHVFFTPGDLAVRWLLARTPHTAGMLGVESVDDSETMVAALSLISWLLVAVLVKAAYNVIRDTIFCVVSLYRRFVAAAAYRFRMIGRAIAAPIRKLDWLLAGRKLRFLEEFEISELQFAVLRAQSMRPPGHAITAIEAAEELRIRPLRAQQALSSLAALHLMEVSFATSDGCPGYFLTRPGEAYVASCDARKLPAQVPRKAPA